MHRKIAGILALFLLFSVSTVWSQSRTDKSRIKLAQDYERRGNYELSLRIFLGLFNQVPRNQLYYEGVKRNMLRLKRYERLIEIINAQIARTNDAKYHADLGNVYYKQGEHEKAIGVWNEVVDEYPQKKTTYTYVASAMVENRLYDEAIGLYKKARLNLQQPNAFVFELANMYIARLKYDDATEEYLNYLETSPAQFNYIEGRIAAYTKDAEQARKVAAILKSKREKSHQPHLIDKLLADLYLRNREFDLAFEEFKQLETNKKYLKSQNSSKGKEIYFFAEKALQSENYLYAEKGFNLILEKYRHSPYRLRALYGLALSKQKQGFAQEALNSYESLIATNRKSPWAEDAAYQIGVIFQIDLFDIPRALTAYHRFIQDYPHGRNSIDIYFRIGDCYVVLGDMEKAKVWYGRALIQNNSNTGLEERVNYKRAYADFLNRNYDESLSYLKKVTGNLTNTKQDQTFANDALELMFFIEDNLKKDRKALDLFSDARRYLYRRNPQKAMAAFQSILEKYPNSNLEDKTLIELAELEYSENHFSKSIAYLKTLLEKHPESVYNAFAQKRIGEIYEDGLADFPQAAAAFEKVLIKYPSSIYTEDVRYRLRRLEKRTSNN